MNHSVLVHHMINSWKFIGSPRRDYEVIVPGTITFWSTELRPLASMTSTTMRRQWRHRAILREESFLGNLHRNKINVMRCTKPINAWFFGYYDLIVSLWEVLRPPRYRSGTILPKTTLWEHSTLKTRHLGVTMLVCYKNWQGIGESPVRNEFHREASANTNTNIVTLF